MTERSVTYRSHLPVSAAEALAWHGREGAFERLSPPWAKVRVIESRGTMHPGDTKRVTIKFGPLTTEWEITHEALPDGLGFLDRQVSGPFAAWTHEHRFADDPAGGSWLEDRITYELPLRPAGNIASGKVEAELNRTFAYRHQVTRHDLAAHARHAEQSPRRIAITGATGLVGRRLVPFLRAGGHTVHRLVRTATGRPDEIVWEPNRGQLDQAALEGFDAVIHLAGVSIAGGRWSDARKQAILESRVKGTALLADALTRLKRPPAVLVSTSAVGYYGNRGDEILTEASATGDGFLAGVCREWEASASPASRAGIRVVHPRLGVVLAGEGGLLAQLARPFRLGLGGKIGDGRHYLSWIAIDDLLAVLLEGVMNDALEGPVNAVAPESITNATFTESLGRALHRPTVMPLPAFAARLAFGEMADELLLVSQRTQPARLETIDFAFTYPTIDAALRHELDPEPLPGDD